MAERGGRSSGIEKKNKVWELLKLPDKAFFFGGVATYVLLGIPLALSIAAVAGATWGASEMVEKGYLKLRSKYKGKS